MKNRLYLTLISWVLVLPLWAVEIHIADPKSWTNMELAPYLNQTVTFDAPMFLLYENGAKLSPYCQSDKSYVVLSGNYPKSQRDRTFSRDLKAKVLQSMGGTYYLEYVSGNFDGNTRDWLSKGLDSLQIDKKDKHTLLVCAANLEYYLKVNVGKGYGPSSAAQHEKQRTKVRQALALINADIYGFCEIEQGWEAVQEICDDLNAAHSGRHYVSVDNGTVSSAGTYTTCLFIYDQLRVHPLHQLMESQVGVKNRKYMQYFVEKETNEGFIFSINHFKAKSGGGDTESTRVAEANSVNSLYNSYKSYCHEEDILIMGDLNAYASEEPITILLEADSRTPKDDRTNLHTYFHPEGSYSYHYGGAVDYLDHAIVSPSMLLQVTGMQAYHVNSDEDDCYTYQGYCNDGTMFRYSDHDPIVVGLSLKGVEELTLKIINHGENFCVRNGMGGYVRMYDMTGNLLYQHTIDTDNYTVFSDVDAPILGHGCYIVHVYHEGVNHVTKYIRP